MVQPAACKTAVPLSLITSKKSKILA